ncbi:MAG: hypothetical protein QM535_22640 [Limnohabitans sp.]|nr:hypothetical protein [Limnohabitans sp.]
METNNENVKNDDIVLENLANEFSNLFTKFTDIEGIIIRGHILVEQYLNKSIEQTVLHSAEFDVDKFSFAQKINIGNMLGISIDLKNELIALNKLRNQIAHSLKFENKYIELIINGIYSKNNKIFRDKNDKINSLITSISFICGYIAHAHKNAKRNFLVQQISELQSKNK